MSIENIELFSFFKFHLNIPFMFSQSYTYERIINLGGDIFEVQTVITIYFFTNDVYYTIKFS